MKKEKVQFQHYTDFVGELKATYRRTSVPSTTIRESKDVIDFIRPYFDECMDNHEEMMIVHVNNANQVVNVHRHTIGGTTGVLYDAKLIFQQALLIRTEGLFIVHNHPSGKLKASNADVDMSIKLSKGAKILGFHLIDSLIITRESYLSLKDESMF